MCMGVAEQQNSRPVLRGVVFNFYDIIGQKEEDLGKCLHYLRLYD